MKKKTEFNLLTLAVLFLCIFIVNSKASGETHYYGNVYIDTDMTWTPAGSPYIIHGNITVRGALGDDQNYPTLTITTDYNGTQGDVEVKFYGNKGMTIGLVGTYSWEKYYGALDARGSGLNRITFTAYDNSTELNYWRGVLFNSTTITSSTALERCVFKYGGNGQEGIIKCRSGININHCAVQSGSSNGIYIENSNPNIDNCLISQNDESGIYVYACNAGSINGSIKNSAIKENAGHGIELFACYTSSVCHPTIDNNEISENTLYGIYCNDIRCNPPVKNNSFTGNRLYPLRISALMYENGYTLTNNVFTGNGYQEIEVIGGGTTIDQFVRWTNNTGIPYIVRGGDLKFACSPFDVTAKFTIDAGTTIKFDPGYGIIMGDGTYPSERYGYLRGNGTKENPVTFTTSQPGQHWKGISFKHQGSINSSWLTHCIVEYGGSNGAGNISFTNCYPAFSYYPTIYHSTIRYSMSDGIKIVSASGSDGVIHNNNIYGNALWDVVAADNHPVNARLNYWGTPNGPSSDLCSSAVAGDSITHEAWLEEEVTEPFRFTDAKASPTVFNPITATTTISFSLSEPASWKLSILNHQFEQLWSITGENSTGDSVTWNGMGNYGVVSGTCYYRIEAHNSSGDASPAMGVLHPGDQNQAIAKITGPPSRSVFTIGTVISISGTALIGAGGYYEVFYGERETNLSWNSISGRVYASKENELLASWDTTGLENTSYIIKLDVHTFNETYTDFILVDFYVDDPLPQPESAIIYSYDNLARLSKVLCPNGAYIQYRYDRTGNRIEVLGANNCPPTLIGLSSLTAGPTLEGIVIEWKTESEVETAGFNLYRQEAKSAEFEKITQSIIPANGSPTAGASYSFIDVPPDRISRWQYQLEEVERTGKTKRYGPVSSRNIAIKNPTGERAFKKSFRGKCE